eukprot:scaffold47730_cov64-Phaeocystis_antarctica.AAC.5
MASWKVPIAFEPRWYNESIWWPHLRKLAPVDSFVKSCAAVLAASFTSAATSSSTPCGGVEPGWCERMTKAAARVLVHLGDGRALQALDRDGASIDLGDDLLDAVVLRYDDVELLHHLACLDATSQLKEGLLEHAAHRCVGVVKVLEPLLLVGLEQLPQQGGGRLEVVARAAYLSLVEGLDERPTQPLVWHGCVGRGCVGRTGEYAQVLGRDVVVGVGLPERRAEAQVVEHDPKRPQVVGHARRVLGQLCSVDLALVIHGPQQHSRHLGRAVAGAWDLAAKGLVERAEDVEVDDLPRAAVADGVERLEVGVDAALGVHVLERPAQVGGDVADGGPILTGDVLVVDRVLEGAVGQLQHQDEAVL